MTHLIATMFVYAKFRTDQLLCVDKTSSVPILTAIAVCMSKLVINFSLSTEWDLKEVTVADIESFFCH